METNKQRYIWIDWMKIIGLYFIILVHFFPPYKSYLNAFNVPLFFIISGFLSKKETDAKTFGKKMIHNMIIPVILILIINFIWDLCVHYDKITFGDLPKRIVNASIGMHGTNTSSGGLGTCWYVYTLIILKTTYQIFVKKTQILLLFISVFTAILLHHKNISLGNAIVDTVVAYPFWCVGLFLHKMYKLKNYFSYVKPANIISFFICAVLLYIAGHYNKTPWMYINGYGNYMSLFLCGALAGTYMIFFISKILDSLLKKTEYIKLLSSGSIIILGLHPILIDCFHLCGENGQGLKPIIYAFIIIVLFIPINIIFKKYFPIIYGKRL